MLSLLLLASLYVNWSNVTCWLLFTQEEEEGSEDDGNVNTNFAVTMQPGFTVRSFLDQLEDEADGFVSPVDDKTPSKSTQELGLGNLHSASV